MPLLKARNTGALLIATVLLGLPHQAAAGQTGGSTGQTATNPATTAEQTSSTAPTLTTQMEAGEAYAQGPRRQLVKWNEYQGPNFSIRVGGGFLVDYVTYRQDEGSQQQFALTPDGKLRDLRILLSGRLGFKRKTTWSAGIMYDGANDEWVMRQTGIMVAIPEIWGDIFVGRTKEGVSLNKVMIGYGGWTNERAPTNDALIPILADGIKWLGYLPEQRLIWNLGFYVDALSESQSFSKYDAELAGRFVFLPILSKDGGTLIHLGVSARYGDVNKDQLSLKARPGAWAAPFFIDTGTFAANDTMLLGAEAYYRPGSITMGSEYYWMRADAPASGNPTFHGGEAFITWILTGEVRGYNTRGGYFNQISPINPVRAGGIGAFEIVGHYSYSDFDAGTLKGGKYWRITPMLNWYFSDNARLELTYGYGSLNRFNVTGKTHFLQIRLQLQL